VVPANPTHRNERDEWAPGLYNGRVRILHNALEHSLQGMPNLFLVQLIEKKLASHGISLSTRERKLLIRKIQTGKLVTFRVRHGTSADEQPLQIEFTPDELRQAEQKFSEFAKTKLPDVISASTDDLSRKILGDLKRKWQAESRRQKRYFSAFSKRLYNRWKAPIESLKMLLTISREFGARVNEDLRDPSRIRGRYHLVEVLSRSHARSCQITEEIAWLLAAGFADGAMARWRTMHEISVVASFIAAGGEELAERYALHEVVESRRAANEYEKYRKRLGRRTLGKGEIRKLESRCATLGQKFGPDFLSPYGWAAHDLKMKKPTFADIERAAGIDHLRPYYRMASHPVHANPKGVFFSLGLMSESQILLAGPSNSGLADPGQCAALSLSQVSAVFGALDKTIDNIVSLKIILQLSGEVGKEFGKAQTILERERSKVGSSMLLY
jgi:hypothetical protein